MPRQGITLSSELLLKPGSNAVIAISPRTGAPESREARIDEVAAAFRDALLDAGMPAVLEYAGPESTGMLPGGRVYTIGAARPIVISEIGPNARLVEWNKKVGEPIGSDVLYYAVNLDWRGEERKVATPAGIVVFPRATRAVTGAYTWPDGDVQAQKLRLQEERVEKRTAAVASATKAAGEIGEFIVNSAPYAILSAGVVITVLSVGAAVLAYKLYTAKLAATGAMIRQPPERPEPGRRDGRQRQRRFLLIEEE